MLHRELKHLLIASQKLRLQAVAPSLPGLIQSQVLLQQEGQVALPADQAQKVQTIHQPEALPGPAAGRVLRAGQAAGQVPQAGQAAGPVPRAGQAAGPVLPDRVLPVDPVDREVEVPEVVQDVN